MSGPDAEHPGLVPSTARSSAQAYMPQLDGLRGCAVIIVLSQHYLHLVERGHTLGHATMGMFFVMSAYLITGILLRLRDRVDAGGLSLGKAYGGFLWRRSLRIFPAYYGVLLLALVGNTGRMQRDFPWHAGYLSNVFAAQGNAAYGTGHFWSLAVEEQFYLVWPWFILLCPRRFMPAVMVLLAAGAVAYRLNVGPTAAYVMTPAQLDYFAAGGLLALLDHGVGGPGQRGKTGGWIAWLSLAGGLGLLTAWYLARTPGATGEWPVHVRRGAFALFAVWLIQGASRGFAGPLGWVLTRRPLVALGEISYGVYLIHLFIAIWITKGLSWLGMGPPSPDWVACIVFGAASIAWGAASWRWFEAPILRLKSRGRP